MKTRTGFVSNSSSSSFIITFDRDPSIRENLAAEMGECASSGDSYYESVSTEEAVDRVHSKIVDQLPATINELMDEFESDISWDLYNKHNKLGRDGRYNDSNGNPSWDKKQEAISEDLEITLAPIIEKFKRDNKDKFVYILEFDDSGSDYVYHQGEPFNNLTYRKVSHH